MRESRQCIYMVTVLPFARLPLREAQSLNDRLLGKSGMVFRSKVERDMIGSFQRSNTKIVGLIRGASVVIFRARCVCLGESKAKTRSRKSECFIAGSA